MSDLSIDLRTLIRRYIMNELYYRWTFYYRKAHRKCPLERSKQIAFIFSSPVSLLVYHFEAFVASYDLFFESIVTVFEFGIYKIYN